MTFTIMSMWIDCGKGRHMEVFMKLGPVRWSRCGFCYQPLWSEL